MIDRMDDILSPAKACTELPKIGEPWHYGTVLTIASLLAIGL